MVYGCDGNDHCDCLLNVVEGTTPMKIKIFYTYKGGMFHHADDIFQANSKTIFLVVTRFLEGKIRRFRSS